MYRNPITGQKHRKWSVLHKTIGKHITGHQREWYDAISRFFIDPGLKNPAKAVWRPSWSTKKPSLNSQFILDLFTPALPETYIDMDHKGRGDAVNVDLYGYDPEQGVAIIQARHFFKRAARHFGNVRKTYFLCGQNENGNWFRHPVSAHTVRYAAKKDASRTGSDTVKAAQKWIWQVTDRQLTSSIRHGDVLFVPQKPIKNATNSLGTTVTIADSHKILADQLLRHPKRPWVYALNPAVFHSKGQHDPLELEGWYCIRQGRDAKAWNFAERLGD